MLLHRPGLAARVRLDGQGGASAAGGHRRAVRRGHNERILHRHGSIGDETKIAASTGHQCEYVWTDKESLYSNPSAVSLRLRLWQTIIIGLPTEQ